MKKVLAMMVAVMAMVGAGTAQKPKSSVAVSKALAEPAVSSSDYGYIIFYNDTSNDLGPSMIFQSTTAGSTLGDIGIGTTSPQATLDVSSPNPNPSLRIDNYSGTTPLSGNSPNFNFASANGTPAAPTATVNGDNLGQFAAAGYTGSGPFGGSKVKVTFQATENWTSSNNGTAMSFQTTANGTTKRTTRLFIDNTGNVGIGSNFGFPSAQTSGTPPPYPLSVTGAIQSSTGGFIFPDSTTQTTAVPSCAAGQIPEWSGGVSGSWTCVTPPVPGVTLTSPGNSILVSGSATAPTVVVNTAVVQPILNGATTCPSNSAITSINPATGAVQCGTIDPGGSAASVPIVEPPLPPFTGTLTGSYSNVGATPTPVFTAATSGLYRVSVYMNTATGAGAGTCPSLPANPCALVTIQVGWYDGVSQTSKNTAVCDLTAACGNSSSIPMIWLPASSTISAVPASFNAGGTGVPTGGSYTAYVLVEKL